MTVQIQPSDSYPGCTQLTVTPDVPGYVRVDFGTGLVVSMQASGTDDEVKANILGQLNLTENTDVRV
jgi:hypothetical protein